MGNESSISSTEEKHPKNDNNNNFTESGAAEDPELRSMRRSLEKNQEVFILNNLMLCVQFFENYEREILEISSSSVSQRENDLNTILSQTQKHILLPGALDAQMSRHVKFTSMRLTDCASTIEPLQPVRMHVVLDNIRVNEDIEKQNDDTLADPIFYKMRLEPSCNYGYVRLRSIGVTRARKEEIAESAEPDLPFIVEDEDELYNENEEISSRHMNLGARFLSRVEIRANTMAAKSIQTQSMTDLYNVDGNNSEAVVCGMGRRNSHDEGYSESPYSGTPERRLSGPFKHPKPLKIQSQIMQRGRSIESIPRSSRSSGYRSGSSGRNSLAGSESSGYSYATTCTSSNTSDFSISRSNLPASSSEIPVSCFKKIVCTPEGKLYNGKGKRKKPRNSGERRLRKAEESLTEGRSYLRSRKFRRYFQDFFFNRLAEPLGFEIEDDTDVTRQGAVIQCYSMNFVAGKPTLVIPYEIVPSISAKNQPECHNDFLERSRRAIFESPNKQSWITDRMIDAIEELGCHIIPESLYSPTRNADSFHAVEWQLTFPAAERYLETCLSNSQAHVYIMALMLRKTFIRSTDPTFELSTSHVRSQLFWLVEKTYGASMWSENRCGESLIKLLNKLYSAVSDSQPFLADYFIGKKINLLANIPRQYLHLAQKQIKRIIDNPVMYMIASMKNIRYKSEFFPVLDYKRLHKLLVIDDRDLVAFIRPDLSRINRPISQSDKNRMEIYEERFHRTVGHGDRVKTKKNPFHDPVKRTGHHQSSVESSNNIAQELVVEITDECAELEGLRLSAILNMFIKHFTKMAERCYEYAAMKQKDIYLNQAQMLSMILKDQAYGEEDAMMYLERIENLRHRLSQFETKEDRHETYDNPTISVPLNEYFINEPDKQGIKLFFNPERETNETHDNSAGC